MTLKETRNPPFGLLKYARDSQYRRFASDIPAVLDASLGRERKRVEAALSTSAPAIIPSNDGGQRDSITRHQGSINKNSLQLSLFTSTLGVYYVLGGQKGVTYTNLYWNLVILKCGFL